MKLEQSFTVDAPVDVVWEALIDIERVAPCLPGAEVTEAADDGTYKGVFTVKLGPTTASYNGVLKMEEVDAAAHRATMHARGTDKRGQGSATASIVSEVREDGAGTRVEVVTDFTITGRLARFGRGGMIEDISNKLLGDFASCLQASLATPAPPSAVEDADGEPAHPGPAPTPPPQAAPVRGFSLVLGVLWRRIVRLVKRLLNAVRRRP